MVILGSPVKSNTNSKHMPGKPTSKVWISADQLHESSNGLTLITATLSKCLESKGSFSWGRLPLEIGTFRTFTARRPSNAANISLVVILRDWKMVSTPENRIKLHRCPRKTSLDVEKPLWIWGADQFNGTWTVSCDLKRIKLYNIHIRYGE